MNAASTGDVLRDLHEGVCTVTLNRVERKNALTGPMYAALADALEHSARDAATRCLLIQGDASVFCAGNDIGDFARAGEAQQEPQEERPSARFLRALATFPKPLLAAVCGPAVGVGSTMLLHCDLVYAGDNAVFSLPFVNLGLCPEAASSLLLPRLLGHQRAAALLMLGESLGAEAALDAGLVQRVVPPAECNALAQMQARKLAAKPLTALMETKRLMKGGGKVLGQEVLAHMHEELQVFSRLLHAPAAKEAFAAFLEKRPPDFRAC